MYTKLSPSYLKKLDSIYNAICKSKEELPLNIQTSLNNLSKGIVPTLLRTNGSGTINTDIYDISVKNVGSSQGLFNGVPLKPDEGVDFNAGVLNNVYASGTFTFDATDTEFIIAVNSETAITIV